MDTLPAPASVRLYRQAVRSAVRAVPVMELMTSDLLAWEQITSLCPRFFRHDLHIPEPHQPANRPGAALYIPGHLPDLSFSVFQFLMKIHKSPAFRQTGNPVFNQAVYLLKKPFVFRQSSSVKLRIPPSEDQAAQTVRQPGI